MINSSKHLIKYNDDPTLPHTIADSISIDDETTTEQTDP